MHKQYRLCITDIRNEKNFFSLNEKDRGEFSYNAYIKLPSGKIQDYTYYLREDEFKLIKEIINNKSIALINLRFEYRPSKAGTFELFSDFIRRICRYTIQDKLILFLKYNR